MKHIGIMSSLWGLFLMSQGPCRAERKESVMPILIVDAIDMPVEELALLLGVELASEAKEAGNDKLLALADAVLDAGQA